MTDRAIGHLKGAAFVGAVFAAVIGGTLIVERVTDDSRARTDADTRCGVTVISTYIAEHAGDPGLDGDTLADRAMGAAILACQ